MDLVTQIEDIFAPGGALAQSIGNYEHRPQQTQMAVQVYQALASGDALIIEAPTGTGKTLAYLVAAALSRKRIAISTGTKNLQEQLFSKDIPFVQEKLFPKLKAALLKGRGNFVCHTRLKRLLRQPYLEGLGSPETLKQIVEWYRWTLTAGEGDRAELADLPDNDPLWPEICSTPETCLGRKCPDKEHCFVLKMRSRAAEVDLMVVNHHLLTSDLAVKESGFGGVIPRYEAVIVDEAHSLEDAATQNFGFHMSRFRISRLARDAASELAVTGADPGTLRETMNAIDQNARRLFDMVQEKFPTRAALGNLDREILSTRDVLCEHLETLAIGLAHLPEPSDELLVLAKRALGIKDELLVILGANEGSEFACWAEPRDRTLFLHASPVEVGDLLRARIYEKVDSMVFTSATLSSGGNCDYFASRMGLDREPRPSHAILGTPFDYATQTMLYIPKAIPEPASPGFTQAIVPVLKQVLEKTGGRAFVLFTSYRNMEEVFARLQGQLPYPLLVQGSRPKGRLLKEFRERIGSVLFATASFWEGVDVQGEALSCVIIDKLPFAPPDDPLVAARMERLRVKGEDPFYSFQVPMAVLALKQGLGRLIRTRSDRGILCILDKRILTKPYGKVFRESLFSSQFCRDADEIDRFFANTTED